MYDKNAAYENLSPLSQLIVTCGYESGVIAGYLGVTEATLKRKVKDNSQFSMSDLQTIASLLPFTFSEVISIATGHYYYYKDMQDHRARYLKRLAKSGKYTKENKYENGVIDAMTRKKIIYDRAWDELTLEDTDFIEI